MIIKIDPQPFSWLQIKIKVTFLKSRLCGDTQQIYAKKAKGLGFGHTIYLPLTHSYVFNTKKKCIFEKMKNKVLATQRKII